MCTRRWLPPLALLAAASATTAAATPPATRTAPGFVRALRDAVDRHDHGAVAKLFHFPATVIVGGYRIPVPDAPTLDRLYDALFTTELRCLIDRSADPAAASAADVVSIGHGTILATRTGDRFQISRIAVAAPGSPDRRHARPPRRIDAGDSPYPAQFSGTLAGDDVDTYLVSLKPRQQVTVRIDGFHGRDAVLRVQTTGGNAAAQNSAPRGWTHVAARSETYRVDVVRQAAFCNPPFSYTLTVTLR